MLATSTDFSNNPRVANIDFFPLQNLPSHPDQSDQAYLSNAYNSNLDDSISNVLNTNSSFNRPPTSIKRNQSVLLASQTRFNPTLPENRISAVNSNPALRPSFNPPPSNQQEHYPSIFSLPTSLNQSYNSHHFSPNTQIASCTPSFCGDYSSRIISPSLSQHILKREASSSPTSQLSKSTPKRPQQTRSNTIKTHSTISGSSIAEHPRFGRLRHNQAERNYRESLSSQFERLRRAVPLLPQSHKGSVTGEPKPSKATIMDSAIKYIRQIEEEGDALREENKRLKFIAG